MAEGGFGVRYRYRDSTFAVAKLDGKDLVRIEAMKFIDMTYLAIIVTQQSQILVDYSSR